MRKKLTGVLIFVLVVVMGMFTGCGKVTAVSLAADVTKAMASKKSLEGRMTFDMDMDIGGSESGIDISMNMEMGMEMDMKVMADSGNSYVSGTMRYAVMGEDESADMEIYTVKEEGKTYVYTGVDDAWMRSEAEEDDAGDAIGEYADIFNQIKDEKLTAELLENTENINDKECYVVKTSITADAMSAMMGQSVEEMFSDMDIDMRDAENLKVDALFYIDKEEKLLRRISMNIESFLNQIISSALQDESIKIDFRECRLMLDMTGYDTVEEKDVTVPEDVKKRALDMSGALADLEDTEDAGGLVPYDGGDKGLDIFGDQEADDDDEYEEEETPQDADGNYVLTNYEGNVQVTVAAPEQLEYSYGTENYLAFTDGDALDICYECSQGLTEEDIVLGYADTEYMASSEDYKDIQKSETETAVFNGMEVRYLTVSYVYADEYNCNDCYAWTEMTDDTYLVVSVSVFGDDAKGEDMMEALFDAVKTGSDL